MLESRKIKKKKESQSAPIRIESHRGIETRQKILTVTGQIISQDGIQNIRYAQIAKIAKIPQALLGYHFPNLDVLLLELVQNELEKLKMLSVENTEKYASTPKKALEAYIRTPFELADKDKIFNAIWTAFYHLSSVNNEFSLLNLRIRNTGRERILNLITMVLATEGQLMGKKQISREELILQSSQIQGIITGLCIMAMSEAHSDFSRSADLAVQSCMHQLGIE